MQGFSKIFNFTLREQLRSKGYIWITAIFALILFLLPAILVPAILRDSFEASSEAQTYSGVSEEPDEADEDSDIYSLLEVKRVYYACDIQTEALDMASLERTGLPGYDYTAFIMVQSFDEAAEKAKQETGTLVLYISESDDCFNIEACTPNGSVSEESAEILAMYASDYFRFAALSGNGLTDEQISALVSPVMYDTNVIADGTESIRETVSSVLIYVNIMVVYFLVLFYGINVANCVIIEKTSKLMDTFLISVKPRAMIAGKMLAVFLAAVIQFTAWIIALLLGFVAGGLILSAITPGAAGTAALIVVAESSGVGLSPAGAVIGILMIFAGFLLYCALSSIGGSLASKPEDLGTSRQGFTIILLISYFAALYSGFADGGGLAQKLTWLDIVPFTSILVTPTRLILGSIPAWMGVISLIIILAVTAVLVLIAGRVYKLMAMYKGKPPKIRQLIAMLKG